MRRVWCLAAVALLLAGACGGDDSEGSGDAAGASAGASDDTTTTVSAAGAAGACPEETSLEIVTGDAEPTELEVVTGWSDQGPHPDNTVDYSGSLALVFTDYEIPIDPQFGYSIPIAGSAVPADGTEIQLSLAYDGVIEAGQTFVDQTADAEVLAEHDGTINFISLDAPDGRAVLGETVVTLTQIDDDVVCGEISGVSETDLQELTAVEGEFVVERIQAIEAEAEAEAEAETGAETEAD
jgi:hypothetical protein